MLGNQSLSAACMQRACRVSGPCTLARRSLRKRRRWQRLDVEQRHWTL